MKNPIHTQLDAIAALIGRQHDGLRTLATLLTGVACHRDHEQRPDDFAHGLSAIINALADTAQATLGELDAPYSAVTALAKRAAELEWQAQPTADNAPTQ